MPNDCNTVSCSQQISKKQLEFTCENYFCRTLTDDTRHKNLPPPLDLT